MPSRWMIWPSKSTASARATAACRPPSTLSLATKLAGVTPSMARSTAMTGMSASRAGWTAAAAELVDGDGGEHDDPDGDLLPERVDVEEVERVPDDRQQQGAGQGAADEPVPAGEAGPPDDHGRDRGEFVAGGGLGLSRGEPSGDDEPGQAGARSGRCVAADEDRAGGDADAPGGRGVAADGVDPPAPLGASQGEGGDGPDAQGQHQRDRNTTPGREEIGAQAVDRSRGPDRSPVGQHQGEATGDAEHGEGDDERRELPDGDEEPVDRAQDRSAEESGHQSEPSWCPEPDRDEAGDDGGECGHAAHRQVDPAGDDDEGQPDGQQGDDCRLLADVEEVLRPSEYRGQGAHDEAEGQDTDDGAVVGQHPPRPHPSASGRPDEVLWSGDIVATVRGAPWGRCHRSRLTTPR